MLQTLLFPLAARFVAGESERDALEAVRRLNAAGQSATIDLLGEDVHDAAAATRVRDGYRSLIARLAAAGVQTNLSVKLSALGMLLDPALAQSHLESICTDAAQALSDPFVRIDMEGSALVEPTLAVFRATFARHRNTGPVLQAYLHRTPGDVADACALGARVRLCKGAYREPPAIALQDMPAIRVRFAELAERLLREGTYPAIATHDATLVDTIEAQAAALGRPRVGFEFQMLYGVRPDLQRRLTAAGYRVRIYVPYGTHWAKYFRRRVMERRENLVFAVRSMFGA